MHAHLKAVYDHICWAYPVVDIEATIDAVFVKAARHIDSMPAANQRVWLFGLVRMVAHGSNNVKRWRERNAAEQLRSLGNTATTMDDWHLWTDINRVITAAEQLPLPDQEILTLITCVDELDAERLAIILDISFATASQTLERVTTRFRQAYESLDPDNAIGGAQ